MTSRYPEIHARSIADPEGFWGEVAEDVRWERRWDRVLDDSRPPFYRWFAGAEVNTCFNAVDRHVEEGRGEQAALIYDSAMTGVVRSISYRELRDLTARFAGVLAGLGVGRGDRVVIYMPMVPEAVVAMLACARLGAVHSVVFGGFASAELASRLDDCTPKVVVAASCGLEPGRQVPYKPLLDGAVEMAAHKPVACVVLRRPEGPCDLVAGRDHDWDEAMAAAAPHDACVPVAATDPLYILYTSGTTGTPKGIVRDNGGHIVALRWTMGAIYDVGPGEAFWAASDVGWVVGHSYIVYGPLFAGCTSILYEGKPVGTPDAGAFWRVIADHKVKALFTAPTAFRAIRREDPDAALLGKYDLSAFKTLFLAGERSDPDTLAWAERILQVPVIDHWWQTETGWSIAANCVGLGMLPVKHGSPSKAAPGNDVRVLAEDGSEQAAGKIGALSVRLPLPPGSAPTLWNAEGRFREVYLDPFPGYYSTGDAGYMDEDGYVFVMSRTDDIINVAGHRLSTGAIEEVLAAHEAVAECAVIGVSDPLKGQLPLGFMVLKSGTTRSAEEIAADVVAMVRERIGPVAAFRTATVVARLPKTRSGKVLRGTMRAIADSADYKVPPTIDDPEILDEISEALRGVGYAGG
jgi:propionyl-CoA synthetase